MRPRVVGASLLIVALFTGGVIVEAEHNYAAVADRDRTTAALVTASAEEGAIEVRIRVHNSMDEPLRLQYVHLEAIRRNATDSASTPYGGSKIVRPGNATLDVQISARQVTGDIAPNEDARIGGEVVVTVYNAYRFTIPIEDREVTL